jgi:hypothetical protein
MEKLMTDHTAIQETDEMRQQWAKHIEQGTPKREWVGLNWDDIPDVFVGDIAFMQGAKWALAKLKEKNT